MSEILLVDEDIFVGLMVGDIRNKLYPRTSNIDGIARMFCRMMNNFRSGIPVVVELSFDRFKEMNFKGSKVTQSSGNEFRIKHKTGHVGFYGKTCTIWFGKGYNRIELKPKNIRWSCVKASDQDLPTGWLEVLKIKFAHIGVRNIKELARIYDTYLSIYHKEYTNQS